MNVSSSLNTEDYNYLINNQDIITTCQEALLENDLSVPSVNESLNAKDDCKNGCNTPSTQGSQATHDLNCHASATSSYQRVPGGCLNEFSTWLDHVERQLDTVCYCMILTWTSKNDTNNPVPTTTPVKQKNHDTCNGKATISPRDADDFRNDCRNNLANKFEITECISAISSASFMTNTTAGDSPSIGSSMSSGSAEIVKSSTPIKRLDKTKKKEVVPQTSVKFRCNDDVPTKIKMRSESGRVKKQLLDKTSSYGRSANTCQTSSTSLASTLSIEGVKTKKDGEKGDDDSSIQTNGELSANKDCHYSSLELEAGSSMMTEEQGRKSCSKSLADENVQSGKNSERRLWRLALHKQKVRKLVVLFRSPFLLDFFFFSESYVTASYTS